MRSTRVRHAIIPTIRATALYCPSVHVQWTTSNTRWTLGQSVRLVLLVAQDNERLETIRSKRSDSTSAITRRWTNDRWRHCVLRWRTTGRADVDEEHLRGERTSSTSSCIVRRTLHYVIITVSVTLDMWWEITQVVLLPLSGRLPSSVETRTWPP
ncbi:hypothetical protein OG21DRAFT_595858 [Imleria badia]|nr:hypothetical protein OG21DRAFT_595858 [Imleria badia]